MLAIRHRRADERCAELNARHEQRLREVAADWEHPALTAARKAVSLRKGEPTEAVLYCRSCYTAW